RLAIEPELLDVLLEDLQRAARAIGPEMGWGGAPAVYPPHLQLACTVLYECLDPGEATLSLAHYRRLGGFDAIVGEHLERVLDTDLADGRDVIARDLFVALVATAQERAIRSESELLATVGAKHGNAQVAAVLEILRSRGLLVRVRGNDEPSWELVHDSLIPRVLAWIDARDLARRRAIEIVRYHLRRSRPGEPSLLGRAELRELVAHASAIAELDEEWQRRAADDTWTPSRLVEQSHRVLRRRRAMLATVVCVALGLGSASMYRGCRAAKRDEYQRLISARDIGRAELSVEAFDLDNQRGQVRGPPGADWSWELHAPMPKEEHELGDPLGPDELVRLGRRSEGNAVIESLEVRGKLAYLVVTRGGACERSIVPIEFEGYEKRATPQQVHVLVPTCQASRVGMVEVPKGTFVFGGAGDPPAPNRYPNAKIPPEAAQYLATFSIDATEVTNERFEMLAEMSFTGIKRRAYDARLPTQQHAHEPRRPVTYVSWFEARAYCRYLGKDLPTKYQWVKALRGGHSLRDNDNPRRTLSWGGDPSSGDAVLAPSAEGSSSSSPPPANPGAAEVATHPDDRSPYGVYDLVGNVSEWMLDVARPGVRVVRGADYLLATKDYLLDHMAVDNERSEHTQEEQLGMRCVLNLRDEREPAVRPELPAPRPPPPPPMRE
ncbi:MAG TPA: SUMF1/EgtB/PvdO family nonheme iron enzyme, partial [Kofleriaceae bacterium]|nr:SUMF1/EgtB/PvdO family nonheme iron enzyme [Kofleriaceae bacterium]